MPPPQKNLTLVIKEGCEIVYLLLYIFLDKSGSNAGCSTFESESVALGSLTNPIYIFQGRVRTTELPLGQLVLQLFRSEKNFQTAFLTMYRKTRIFSLYISGKCINLLAFYNIYKCGLLY